MSLDTVDARSLAEDQDFQKVLESQQRNMQFQQQINKMSDICWDTCVPEKITNKFDKRTEQCLTNCVGRFIDATFIVTKKFGSIAEKTFTNVHGSNLMED